MARKNFRPIIGMIAALLVVPGLGCGDGSGGAGKPQEVIVVTSLQDPGAPLDGRVTLREAMASIDDGGRIVFSPRLNGGTILLSMVGEPHSILPGESYPAGMFVGYVERDYGRSALYARKNVTIDASALPDGITITWDGRDHARVLAVYGDLVLNHVTVTSGWSAAEALADPDQPYTLARGGGIATWGTAVLTHCTLSGNRTEADANASRDRGSFGGGIYGNLLVLQDCVVSGNSAKGYGAAGGGVYSEGGAGLPGEGSRLVRTTVSGNRITAQHAYGGGVFSCGGGPGNAKTITLENCTLARNQAEDNPEIPETSPSPPPPQYYYRGGGFYMSNGSVKVIGSTIAENSVTGHPAVFSGKPNMGGGGMAATIGNAHVVENMVLQHSIVAGNLVNGAADDVYTGSLLYFFSYGYNRIGKLNFDQILAPIPPWWSLSRKFWPRDGDRDGVEVSRVLALGEVKRHPSIVSVGTDAGEPAVRWYPPAAEAINQVPAAPYLERYVFAQYVVNPGMTDDFLFQVLTKLRTEYGFPADFGSDLESAGVTWQGTDNKWPSKPENVKWIKFWRDLDVKLGDSLGTAKLGDDFWESFAPGALGDNLTLYFSPADQTISLLASDQRGRARPAAGAGDIGAIENQD